MLREVIDQCNTTLERKGKNRESREKEMREKAKRSLIKVYKILTKKLVVIGLRRERGSVRISIEECQSVIREDREGRVVKTGALT